MIGATNPLEATPGSIRGDYRGRGGPEHGARVGLARVGGARGGAVLPRAGLMTGGDGAADPRLPIAAAASDPRAAGGRVRGRVPGVEELEAGPPHEVAARERLPQGGGRRGAGRPDALVLGVDTVVALGSTLYGKPVDVAAARATLRALSGRRHVVVSGLCVIAGRTAADGGRHHAGATSARSTRRSSSGTSPAMSGASGLAATRSRAAVRRWWRGSKATTRTSSGYRW